MAYQLAAIEWIGVPFCVKSRRYSHDHVPDLPSRSPDVTRLVEKSWNNADYSKFFDQRLAHDVCTWLLKRVRPSAWIWINLWPENGVAVCKFGRGNVGMPSEKWFWQLNVLDRSGEVPRTKHVNVAWGINPSQDSPYSREWELKGQRFVEPIASLTSDVWCAEPMTLVTILIIRAVFTDLTLLGQFNFLPCFSMESFGCRPFNTSKTLEESCAFLVEDSETPLTKIRRLGQWPTLFNR